MLEKKDVKHFWLLHLLIKRDHPKKKKMWNYCHKPGHDISEWRKREAREEKKKQVGLSVTTSTSKKEEAHIAQQ